MQEVSVFIPCNLNTLSTGLGLEVMILESSVGKLTGKDINL